MKENAMKTVHQTLECSFPNSTKDIRQTFAYLAFSWTMSVAHFETDHKNIRHVNLRPAIDGERRISYVFSEKQKIVVTSTRALTFTSLVLCFDVVIHNFLDIFGFTTTLTIYGVPTLFQKCGAVPSCNGTVASAYTTLCARKTP